MPPRHGIDDEADDGLGDEDEADDDGGDRRPSRCGRPRPRAAERADEPWTLERRAERMAELRRAMQLMGSLNFLAEEEYARLARAARLPPQAGRPTCARRARTSSRRSGGSTRPPGRCSRRRSRWCRSTSSTTFDRLFPGGEASLSLQGGDPLEGDIEIAARPRGKKLESIRLLSSGERALTAIALLFAIYLAKPSPVCLLDEVDAPLDDANLDRFLSLVRHFSERTQFICITHNKKTMEMADRLFGVTMEEPGISKLVSVQMDGRDPGFHAGALRDGAGESEGETRTGVKASPGAEDPLPVSAEEPVRPVSERSAPPAEGPVAPGAV